MEDILTFFVLFFLETVLSIDNIVFISVTVENLKPAKRKTIVFYGLGLAILMRMLMLFGYKFIVHIEQSLIYSFSIADFILISGGIFLIFKSAKEIYNMFNKPMLEEGNIKKIPSDKSVISSILEIVFIDFVFSIDSILTAVAMTKNFLMITVVFIINMIFMGLMSKITMKYMSKFHHLKFIALLFIVMIGIVLILQGFGIVVPKYWIFGFFFGLLLFLPIIKRFVLHH